MSPCRIVFFLPMPYCQIDFFCRCCHARSSKRDPGHSAVLFADPFAVPFANPFADLPEKPPLSRKVHPKRHPPSGKMAPSMEGPPEKHRTFRENGPWHGRSPGKAPDLPGKRPLAWKVPRKSAGPSGKTTPFPEGSLDGEVAVHQKCRFGGWRRREAGRGGMRRHATPG